MHTVKNTTPRRHRSLSPAQLANARNRPVTVVGGPTIWAEGGRPPVGGLGWLDRTCGLGFKKAGGNGGSTAMTDTEKNKKLHILQAATVLLRDRGVQALSFENVAKEAGLSRQLVRYYYPDLDRLVADLCDHLAGTYRDILVSGIVDLGRVDRLNFFLDFFFGLAADHPMPENLEVYDAMVAYAVGSPDMRDRMCLQYKTLGDVIQHELAIVHPTLDGRACEELSYLFVSMMHAHWSFVASLGYADGHGALMRRAIDRLIQSYLAETAPVPALNRPWAWDS